MFFPFFLSFYCYKQKKISRITFNDKQINCRDNDRGTEFIDPIIFHYRYDCCESKHDIYRTDVFIHPQTIDSIMAFNLIREENSFSQLIDCHIITNLTEKFFIF